MFSLFPVYRWRRQNDLPLFMMECNLEALEAAWRRVAGKG